MRRKFIAGNWKMNKTADEGAGLVRELVQELADSDSADVAVCPPFTALAAVAAEVRGTHVDLGAQNMHWEGSGAYTGEVSAGMLLALGCKYVILGHSERRQLFGETSETVNRKLKAALEAELSPIVCVGEILEQREAGKTEEVVFGQVRESLADLDAKGMIKVTLAYEPVWAIGTGKTATPEQAQEVHAGIRNLLGETFGKACAEAVRIQYGGSVKPANAKTILAQADVDGALVGGASLKAADFAAIVRAV
ncbi:MAG: triose-phosphate isomerase [Planctomycetota bacterium]|jgi:triosephosphate isomerase